MRTRFHQQIDDLREKLLRMGGLAEQAVERAFQAYTSAISHSARSCSRTKPHQRRRARYRRNGLRYSGHATAHGDRSALHCRRHQDQCRPGARWRSGREYRGARDGHDRACRPSSCRWILRAWRPPSAPWCGGRWSLLSKAKRNWHRPCWKWIMLSTACATRLSLCSCER